MASQLPAAASSLANYGRPPGASDDPRPPAAAAVLRHEYDAGFAVTPDYQASLPDLMREADDGARRSAVPIQQVGISGFKLPLRFRVAPLPGHAADSRGTRRPRRRAAAATAPGLRERRRCPSGDRDYAGNPRDGTVALDADLRAINMSRIIRTFYEFEAELFTLDTLPKILARIRETVGTRTARLRLDFSFPMLQRSLRSGLVGYQYYDAVFEASSPPARLAATG